jgi:hypothetical protein
MSNAIWGANFIAHFSQTSFVLLDERLTSTNVAVEPFLLKIAIFMQCGTSGNVFIPPGKDM